MKQQNIEQLPEHIRDGVLNYVEKGWPIGGFLTAVFTNNLMEAFARADDINRVQLYAICSWVYNEAPSGCWGNPAKVRLWLEAGGLAGIARHPLPEPITTD